jgi:hypothetical protein
MAAAAAPPLAASTPPCADTVRLRRVPELVAALHQEQVRACVARARTRAAAACLLLRPQQATALCACFRVPCCALLRVLTTARADGVARV